MLSHVTAATRGLPGKPGAAPPSSTARPTEGPAGFLHHFTPSRTPDPGTLDIRKADGLEGRLLTSAIRTPAPGGNTSWASPRCGRQPPPQRCRHRQKGLEPLGGPCCTAHRGPQGPYGLAAAANRSAVLPPPPRPACWGGPGGCMTPTAL